MSAAARSGAPVDVIFLDVQMPEMDGFAMLEALYALPLDPMPVVVFATAHDAYALRAFDAHAVDYLLKPYSDERFEVALTRAIRLARSGASDSLFEQMQALLRRRREITRRTRGRIAWRQLPRPARTQGTRPGPSDQRKRYSMDRSGGCLRYDPHRARGKYLHREVLGRLEAQLDPRRFVRIHRSHIVNFDFVHELLQDAHGDYEVILKDAAPLKVSRMYRSRLEERLNQRL